MTPVEWATLPLKKYADFTGRARRMEYWMFVLLAIVAGVVAGIIDGILGMRGAIAGVYGPLGLIVGLGLLVPGLAAGVRRLHDTNRSGKFILIGVVPYALSVLLWLSGSLVLGGTLGFIALVGGLALLVLMALEGTKGSNKYGPDPLEGERAAAVGTGSSGPPL